MCTSVRIFDPILADIVLMQYLECAGFLAPKCGYPFASDRMECVICELKIRVHCEGQVMYLMDETGR